eukprot:13700573-Alexandrium_andersonii.AAC.1
MQRPHKLTARSHSNLNWVPSKARSGVHAIAMPLRTQTSTSPEVVPLEPRHMSSGISVGATVS